MPYGNHGAYDQSYLTPFGNLYYEATRIPPKQIYGGGRYSAMTLPKDIRPVKIEPDKFKVYEKEGFEGSKKSLDFVKKDDGSCDMDRNSEPTYNIFGIEFSMESLMILMILVIFLIISVAIRISNYANRNYSMDLSRLLSDIQKQEELKVIVLSK